MRRRTLLGGSENEFVDLGLPSGIKWAKGNICRNGNSYYIGKPTDYGCYFSWGNNDGHNSDDLLSNGEYIFSRDYYIRTPGVELFGNISSTSQFDAAYYHLGNGKHMPTRNDFIELFNNTDSQYMAFNGVRGWMLWKPNCQSEDCRLFLPDARYIDYSYVASNANRGYYWSSNYYNFDYAYYLYFNENRYNAETANDSPRYRGCSIRAVMD